MTGLQGGAIIWWDSPVPAGHENVGSAARHVKGASQFLAFFFRFYSGLGVSLSLSLARCYISLPLSVCLLISPSLSTSLSSFCFHVEGPIWVCLLSHKQLAHSNSSKACRQTNKQTNRQTGTILNSSHINVVAMRV